MMEALRAQRDRALLRFWRLRFKDVWYRRTINRVLSISAEEKSSIGIRRTVRLLGNFPGLWQRTIEQTPGGSCRWGSTLFVADGEADHYVILNSLTPEQTQRFSDNLPVPERVWGLHMEPEDYVLKLGYDSAVCNRFVSRFYTNSESLLAQGGIYHPSPPYVHFHVGKSWDFLRAAPASRKTVTLGIITSSLHDLAGQRARLQFLEALDASGLDYALWGRGEGLQKFRHYRGFTLSKWDAHVQCRYSIVIENSTSPLYWSEKPVDALLAHSLPLYHGSPQLGRYLPQDSFIPIDIFQPDAIDRIRQVIGQDPYEGRLPAILAARNILLEKANLYAFLDRELNEPGAEASR